MVAADHPRPIELASKPIWSAAGGRWGRRTAIDWRRAVVRAAARSLVAESGVDGVRMRQLADRSSMSVQTLYNNFGSRDAILLSAIEEHTELQLARAWQEATETRLNPIFVTGDLTARLLTADFAFIRKLLSFLHDAEFNHPFGAVILKQSTRSHLKAMRATQAANCLRPWVDCEGAVMAIQRLMVSMLGDLVASEDSAVGAAARYEYRMATGAYLLGVTRGAEAKNLERRLAELSRAGS